MAQLIDHVWQSAGVVLLIWCLASMTRRNSAGLRLWLWRIAALKFLVPFSVVYALGSRVGFPTRHSAIPPPSGLLDAVASATPWATPMQVFAASGFPFIGGLLLIFGLSALCVWATAHELQLAGRQRTEEIARAEGDAYWQPVPLGMLKATTLAAAVFSSLAAPLVAGALHDRVLRQEALALDIESLRTAPVSLTEANWRFGDRPEIRAVEGGVTIRNVNLQDLVAMVYGIDHFEVFGGALPWLESPHYNVQVSGPLHAPGMFDPYSLRQPVTQYLYDQYGVSIRVNGNCQEPCLNQESFVVERIPWTLSKMISGKK
ncbi:MAG: hypothetical protein K0Q92_1039 [Steroidobacteraceae bacterium]|jgi:hypothetical protein|nr:hypothetical protein [Steroidobacteraceae bacterium]